MTIKRQSSLHWRQETWADRLVQWAIIGSLESPECSRCSSGNGSLLLPRKHEATPPGAFPALPDASDPWSKELGNRADGEVWSKGRGVTAGSIGLEGSWRAGPLPPLFLKHGEELLVGKRGQETGRAEKIKGH